MQAHETKLSDYPFLKQMKEDDYFPNHLVDKGASILLSLCVEIEAKKPNGEEVYQLTHSAAEQFNDLQEEFLENGSEFDTIAREIIAEDFEYILEAYGYESDIEEAIAPRDW